MAKSKSFQAKWPGTCPICKRKWTPGKDWLNYVDNVLQHTKCPANGQPALGTSVKTASNYRVNPHEPSRPGVVHQYGVNEPLPIVDYPIHGSEMVDNLIDFEKLEKITDSLDVTAETPREEIKSFVPSQYQEKIFDFIVNGSGHGVVEAVAGSGKTTTIVKALDLTPKDAKVAFIAFNRHIVAELQKRSPQHVTVSTLHKLGKDNIKRHFPKAKIDSKGEKLDGILNEIWPVSKDVLFKQYQTIEDHDESLADKYIKDQRKLNYPKRAAMRRLVSFCKSTLADVNDKKKIIELIDRYNIEIDVNHVEEIVGHLPNVLEQCKNNTDVIDFDDMPWLPVVLKLDCFKFDYLLVDEFQDMSYGNIEFLLMCLTETGRMICVGDRFQSLYAFRGAASDAIPMAIERLNATVLPLSVTYRCPTSHVKIAQKFVPQLEARDNAPAGSVEEIDYFDLVSELKPRDMVICRTNAPLVKPAFECVRKGMKAIIRSDIEKQLLDLIARFDTDNLQEFKINLMEYFNSEYQKKMDHGKEMQAEILEDKVKTLVTVMAYGGQMYTVSDLKKKIKSLFGEDVDGVIFSSVHKAKGLEADTVYILRPDLMPHKRAKKDFEIAQEHNAEYVAKTRSKDRLIMVIGKGNDEDTDD